MVVAGDQTVVVGGVHHQVCRPDLCRQDRVLQAVDRHRPVVSAEDVLGVGGHQWREGTAGDV